MPTIDDISQTYIAGPWLIKQQEGKKELFGSVT